MIRRTGPKDQRQEGVSFEVHRILASAPHAYELIKSPPVNERTGRSQWSGHAAERLRAGRPRRRSRWKRRSKPFATSLKRRARRTGGMSPSSKARTRGRIVIRPGSCGASTGRWGSRI
ncbi:DUF6192 family protein [Streptomyces sp. cg2]|uniref:DUF6192 family protein n=1 Tax=Streptomyces sp. cg2 TaxID=3238799 RepID=UPI0034E1ECAB